MERALGRIPWVSLLIVQTESGELASTRSSGARSRSSSRGRGSRLAAIARSGLDGPPVSRNFRNHLQSFDHGPRELPPSQGPSISLM